MRVDVPMTLRLSLTCPAKLPAGSIDVVTTRLARRGDDSMAASIRISANRRTRSAGDRRKP
jgi:hypothetical protein